MKAVIMAGGRGTRVRPYTNVLPKPMLPVGNYPVLEIVIRQLERQGFDEVILSLAEKSEIVKNFFGNSGKFKAKLTFSEESHPLGTAGHLGSLKGKLTDSFLVMNGDTIADMDYRQYAETHKKSGAAATLAIKTHISVIEYGVPKLDADGKVVEYKEKPSSEVPISIGIYMLEPEVLDFVEKDKFLDMPDLVRKLIEAKKQVRTFALPGDRIFYHLSKPVDFEKANESWRDVIKQLKLDDVLDTSDGS
jgi:NDP-sugar pyrophosphorylase family protein